jgi:DNA-directed RNA polymerase specialized sigma24 family protein
MVTVEEFHTMAEELLYRQPACFDTLYGIANRVLRSSVERWCREDGDLKGRGCEDDVMQEIHIRLIKTTVTRFLLRDGVQGPYNDDPAGFEDWMFTVAHNVQRDYARRVRLVTMRTTDLEEAELADRKDPYQTGEDRQRTERLAEAFQIVLSSDTQIYKVLTWMAQCLFIVELDVTRIQSNELILQQFADKSLYDMHEQLLRSARNLPWLQISPDQQRHLQEALDAPYDRQRCYGHVKYREFFMKKGGKATISDWVNRMNSMIKRVTAHEASNS